MIVKQANAQQLQGVLRRDFSCGGMSGQNNFFFAGELNQFLLNPV
jgi:hypothetical protein